MKKVAIKYTINIPDRQWGDILRHSKRVYALRTDSQLRNHIKGIAEYFGNDAVGCLLEDATQWLEENDPAYMYTKLVIDANVEDYKNHINPSKEVKKNMDEFVEFWDEGK